MLPSMGSLVPSAMPPNQQQLKGTPLAQSAPNMPTPNNPLNNNKSNTTPFGVPPQMNNASITMTGILGLNNMTANNGNGTSTGVLDALLGPMGASTKSDMPNMLPNFDDPVEQSLASLCKYIKYC